MPSPIITTPRRGGGSGEETPKPKAILSISAHWYVPETGVTVTTAPRTIHDFGGFPQELYQVQYPAPGDPALARRVQQLLAPLDVKLDNSWGLDHGTWSVLRHVYPAADIPVVQLSIDETKPASYHFEIGRKLAPLREEGVLIVGSGNLVHNLHTYAWGRHPREPYDWAVRFESAAKNIDAGRRIQAAHQLRDARIGRRAVDTDTGSLFAASLRCPYRKHHPSDVRRGIRVAAVDLDVERGSKGGDTAT